ncbi:hypothetical protein EAG14_13465 [Acidovorax sp. 1608163]|nr:hypothetical protein EAG14_13465 [Acidovorax sp. 1608163]
MDAPTTMTAGAGTTRLRPMTVGATETMAVIETTPATETEPIATAETGKTESATTEKPSGDAPLNAFSRHPHRQHKARTGSGAMPGHQAKASLPTTIAAEAPGLQTRQTADRLRRPLQPGTMPCLTA